MGAGGVKITPAWGHCYFTKLRSSTNGVLIGAVKLQPNHKPNVSFGHFALGGNRERWQTLLMKKLLVSIRFRRST